MAVVLCKVKPAVKRAISVHRSAPQTNQITPFYQDFLYSSFHGFRSTSESTDWLLLFVECCIHMQWLFSLWIKVLFCSRPSIPFAAPHSPSGLLQWILNAWEMPVCFDRSAKNKIAGSIRVVPLCWQLTFVVSGAHKWHWTNCSVQQLETKGPKLYTIKSRFILLACN